MRPHLTALLLAGCGDGAAAPMWRVGDSLLLGTMHAEVDVDDLPPAVFDDLERARKLIIEADVLAADPDEFMAAITLPDGATIQGMLPHDDWVAVVDALAGKLPTRVYNTLQPWWVDAFLVTELLPEVDPIEPGLIERARRAGVDVGFLETWQEQVSYLNGLGPADGLMQLSFTARHPQAVRDAHAAWAETYRDGNTQALRDLAFERTLVQSRPRYYEEIVFLRNQRWLGPLEQELAAGRAVVAVGFMHMLTERGVVRLLRDRGWEVERVEP